MVGAGGAAEQSVSDDEATSLHLHDKHEITQIKSSDTICKKH